MSTTVLFKTSDGRKAITDHINVIMEDPKSPGETLCIPYEVYAGWESQTFNPVNLTEKEIHDKVDSIYNGIMSGNWIIGRSIGGSK